MKKQIVSVFIILALLSPAVAGAQVVTAQNQQLTALINQTIALIQQLINKLMIQLSEMQAAESTDQATTTEETITEEAPAVTIENESLIYRFNAPGLDDKYLVDLKLKAKRNFLKATLIYYTYSSDDSTNRIQTTKVIRSIDSGEIIELNDVKYSIEFKDINNRQLQITEWLDITEASGTSNGETINVGF